MNKNKDRNKQIEMIYKKGENLEKELTFNERVNIFKHVINLKIIPRDKIRKLFTKEEIIFLFNHLNDNELQTFKFYYIEPDILKNLKENIHNIYDFYDFVNDIEDKDIRFVLLLDLQYKRDKNEDLIINQFALFRYIREIDSCYRFILLKNVIKHFSKINVALNYYYFNEILDCLNEDEIIKIFFYWNKYNEEIDLYNFPNILRKISTSKRLDFLIKFLDTKKYKGNFRANEIYNLIDNDNKDNFLLIIIKYNLLDDYNLEQIIKNRDIDKKIHIIDLIINNDIVNYGKLLGSNNIARILESENIENGRKIFKKYCIDDKVFKDIMVLNNITDENLKFDYLDFILSNIDIENTPEKIKIINTLFNRDVTFGRPLAKGNVIYPNIISVYSRQYNVDKDNLIKVINRLDYNILIYLENENISKLINLDSENLDKILSLLDKDYCLLNKDNLNDICNSLLQREFRITQKNDYEIFAKFETIINSNNPNCIDELESLLVKIGKRIDIKKYLDKNYSISSFLLDLSKGKKDAINTLHDMTQEYIKISREKYVKDNLNDTLNKLNVDKKVEKNIFKKLLIKNIELMKLHGIMTLLPEEILNEKEKKLRYNFRLFENVFNFKKGQTNINDEIKEYLKPFEELLNKIYEYEYENVEKYIKDDNAKLVYIPKSPNIMFLLNIINALNIDQLKDTVLNDSEIFEELKSLIGKYNILGFGNTFSVIEREADIMISEGTIASLISNFSSIRKNIKTKNFTEYMDYANCYDEDSLIYSKLLGKENYRLLSSNTGNNKSNTTRKYRLDNIPKLVNLMYSKTESSIPCIKKTYTTKNGKNIGVNLGNSTNMINLTYGERTGACLRVGGAFNDLFEFCLENKNGFHIRFLDPYTKELITRVSGIRNGNTIFLNELRFSLNKNYDDEEIYEVLKQVSDDLMKIDQGIENIVISSDFAMMNYDTKAINSKLENEKNPFYGLNFNINKQGKLIVVKTRNKNNTLRPYKLNIPYDNLYEPLRDDIVISHSREEAKEYYEKMVILNQILNGTKLEDIDYSSDLDILFAMNGEDYCIYVDGEYNIHKLILDARKNNKEVYDEIDANINIVENFIKTHEYGGEKHEKIR